MRILQKRKISKKIWIILPATALVMLTGCSLRDAEQEAANRKAAYENEAAEASGDSTAKNPAGVSVNIPGAVSKKNLAGDEYQEVPVDEDIWINVLTVDLKSGPGADYETIGSAVQGHLYHQTALTSNGWSKIDFYEESAYLRTTQTQVNLKEDEEYTEKITDEDIWINVLTVSLKSGPGAEFETVGTAVQGRSFHRIARISNGWSKIEFEDDIAYLRTTLTQTVLAPVELTGDEGDLSAQAETGEEEIAGDVPAQEETKEDPAQEEPKATPVQEEPKATPAPEEVKPEAPVQEEVREEPPAPAVNAPVAPTGSVYCTGVAKEIFDATNAVRLAAGQVALEWSDDLASAAGIRSQEIAEHFSHTRPDGSSWSTVSSLVGGENLMRGVSSTGQQIVDAWMNSPGHKDNLLYPDFRKIGISTYNESRGMTACQSFGY